MVEGALCFKSVQQCCALTAPAGSQIRTSAPPAPPPKDVRASKAKARERQRREAPVEQEVDRIIDSQDNEYVLSRPKCAPAGHVKSYAELGRCVLGLPSSAVVPLHTSNPGDEA